MKGECEICKKKSMENKVICSDHCGDIRQMMFDLDKKYFPTNGCDNCWGDLGTTCSTQCKEEFQESREFYGDMWKLVRLILKLN